MHDLIFVGDRLTAAGFRLAGIASFAPEPDRLVERIEAERKRCKVLAVTAATYAALPDKLARALRQSDAPMLAVLPDMDGATGARPPDMDEAVRRALGIEV